MAPTMAANASAANAPKEIRINSSSCLLAPCGGLPLLRKVGGHYLQDDVLLYEAHEIVGNRRNDLVLLYAAVAIQVVRWNAASATGCPR